ncbi:membrane protein insertase YidC [Bacillaceae bacterium S4-13-58]
MSVFTSTKKYSLVLLLLVLVLTGCGVSNEPINAETSGWFNHYFVYNFSQLIKWIAELLGGNYGLSIIAMTLLIRLALLPLMMKQSKGSYASREKMQVIKPELDELQNKYKGKKDPESRQKMQQEMMQLYQKHQFNPIASIGCLPLIIQFPILIGFYYAILRTPEIASHTFLWFNLGQVDYVMPFIAAAIYYLQFKVSMIGMDPAQQKQMAFMGLLSPLMIGFVSFTTPAALPLYWTVGGLFLIGQSLLFKKLYAKKDE